MLEPDEKGSAKSFKNGSKRLVAAIHRLIKEGTIKTIAFDDPTGVEITYLGKQRNATNQYSHDSWDLKRLV